MIFEAILGVVAAIVGVLAAIAKLWIDKQANLDPAEESYGKSLGDFDAANGSADDITRMFERKRIPSKDPFPGGVAREGDKEAT